MIRDRWRAGPLGALLCLLMLCAAACGGDLPPLSLPELDEIPPPPPGSLPDSSAVDVFRADVTFRGSTVRYVGHLGRAGVDHFFRTIEKHEGELETLEIASVAGTPAHARRLGDWVAEHEITVVVEAICYSECANYVFTAAPRKIIRDHGLVAWNGTWGDATYLAEHYKMSWEEYVKAQIAAREQNSGLGLDSGSGSREGA